MAVENSIPEAGYTNGADDAFDYISENHERAGSAMDLADVAPGETVRIEIGPGQALRPQFDITGGTVTRDGSVITISLPNGGVVELAAPSEESLEEDPPLLLQPEPVFAALKEVYDAQFGEDEQAELTSAQDGTALEVPRPIPGETDEYLVAPGQTVILGFSLEEVEVLQTETDIILVFGDGSQITLSALVGMALSDNPPNFIEPGGAVISSSELLELAGDMTALAETLDGIETAAGGGDVAPVTNFGFGAPFGDSGFSGGGGGAGSGTTPGGGGGGGGAGGGGAALVGGGTAGAPGGGGTPAIEPPPPPPAVDTIPEITAIPLTFGEETLDVVIPPIQFPDALLSIDFGDDGEAAVTPVTFAAQTLADLTALNLTSGGDALSFQLTADGTEIIATAGAPAATIFVLQIETVTDGYSYSFDLQGPLDHAAGDGANTLALPITVVAEDGDGSTASASFDITVVDGMPKVVSFGPDLSADNVSVDEDDLTAGSDGSGSTLVSGSLGLTGELITLDYGTDGPAAGAPDALEVGDFDLVLSGQPPAGLTSNGVAVTYSAFDPQTGTITASAGGQTVFTVTLKSDGTYDFNLLAPLDHPAGAGQNSMALNFTVTASPSSAAIASALDADGDAVSQDVDGNPLSLGDIEISRNFAVTVVDDVPATAGNDTQQVEEGSGQVITGDVLAAAVAGADGVSLTGFTYTDANGDPQTGTFGTPVATQFGSLTVNANGTWSYTATSAADNDDVPEADGFIYTLTDGDGDEVTAVQAIEVLDSAAPVVTAAGSTVAEADITDTAGQDISVTFGADGAGSVTLADTTAALDAAGFTSNGDAVIFTLSNDGLTLTGSANGSTVVTVAISGNATDGFRYDATLTGPLDHPAGDADLNLPITIVATDGDGTQTSANASIAITDDGPVANDDTVVVVEEASGSVGTDQGADNLLANDDLGADGGSLVSFTYTDANGASASANAGSTVTTQFGSLTVNGDGTWSYTPGAAANNAGGVSDGFTYTVRDADGDEASATQGITITDSGAPVLSAAGSTVAESEITDTAGQSIDVTFGADGVGSVTLADTTAALDAASFTSNGDAVTFTLSNDGLTLTGSANGSTVVTVAISGNATDGFRYDATLTGPLDHPAGDADLNLPITIVATDGDGTQTSANASIAITDDGPVANDDTVVVVEEASGSVGTDQGAANLLANDDLGADGGSLVSFTYTDANGASASANAGSTVTTQFGSLTVNADGTWSYTPGAAANNAGGVSDGFTYTVRDADGDEASATQGITITDSGAPVLSAAGSTVAESEITDTAGQSIDVTFGADGAGSVTLADTTAALDAAGFTSNGDAVTFTLSNDGLTLTGSANGSTVVSVAISGNATDGFRYDATLTGPLDHPAGGADLNLPITIVATDGDGTQASGNASIAITDDGPVAVDDAVVVVEEASGSVGTAQGADNLLANDNLGADGGSLVSFTYTDANGASASANAGSTVTTQFGSLTVNADGTWSYTPGAAANNAGGVSDGFTYTVRDADGDEAFATQGITITDSGAPVLSAAGSTVAEADITDTAGQDISVTFGADGAGSVTLADTTAALDAAGFTSNGDAVTFTLSNDGLTLTGSANGSTVVSVAISGNATDGFRYDATLTGPLDHPAGDADLNLPITIVATDGDGTQTSANASIAITDDGPVANDDTVVVVEEASGSVGTAQGADNLLANDDLGADGGSLVSFTYTDANGASASANAGTTVTTQFGSLTVNADGTWSYTPGAAANNAGGVSDGFTYTVRDADGDEASATQGITITDSGAPVLSAAGSTVAEADITDTAGQDISVTFGADGAGSVTLADTTAALDAAGFTSNGDAVTFTLSNDGLTLTGSANGSTVVTVAISGNATDGFRYDATLTGPLDHPAGDADLNLPVTIVATDGDGTQTSANASIAITDDGPVANDDTVVVVEEASGSVGTAQGADNLLANDDLGADGGSLVSFTYTDANGASASANAGSTVITQFGSLTVNADGTWSYTPGAAANNAGGVSDGFTYTVRDADGDEASATQGITITDSGAPVLSAAGSTVAESDITDTAGQSIDVTFGADGAGSVTLADTTAALDAAGFTSNGDAVTFTLSNDGLTLTGSANGSTVVTVAISGNATDGFRYDATLTGPLDHPAGDADLNLPITIVATDGDGTQTSANASIAITDDGPVANDDTVIVVEEASGSVGTAQGAENLLANDDLGADGGSLVSFTYTDANGASASANAGSTVTTQFGSLTVNGDGTWSYTPGAAANNAGGVSDGFTYTVRDADGDEASATQSITITDSGAPVLSAAGSTVAEADITDTAGQSIDVTFGADGVGSVTLADTTAALDAAGFTSNGDAVTFTLSNDGLTLTGSANGSTVVTVAISGNATDGFRYDATLTGPLDHPAGDADLNLPITIVATDGDGTQTSANASIAITDDGPVAVDDAVVVVEEASGSVGTAQGADNLLANDNLGADGGELVSFTYTDANGASASANAGSTVTTQFGSLTVNGDGTWSYTPGAAANNAGGVSDGFTYTVRDADGDEASATQGITITDSGAPVLSAAGSTVAESEITDTAGQDISVTFGADGVGSVTLADTTAALDAAGFTSNGDAVTFTLSNDGLILTGSANGSTVVTVAISGNATDGFRYDATLTGPLDHPPGDADLNLPITIVATDGDGTQTSANASIAITDDGPVANDDTVVVVEEASGSVGTAQGADNLLANDDLGADGGSLVSFTYTDANGASASANAGSTVTTQFGSLTVNADGTWSYTPGAAANNAGGVSDGFTYTVRDADGDEASATQGITITDSGAPVLSAAGSTVAESDITDTAGQSIDVTFGADGAGSVTLADTTAALDAAGFTSNGDAVTFTLSNDGLTLTGSANGSTVVTVAISGNATDGFRYDATLTGPLDHPAGDADLNLPITIVATDGDGTQTSANASIAITDDGPVAVDDAVVVVEEASGSVGTAQGADNLLANDDLGADGGSLVSFTYTDANGASATANVGSTVTTQFGSLTVNGDGTWSYTPGAAANNAGGVSDGFTYTVRDADGDEASATQGITITDSGAPVLSAAGSTVAEADITDTAGQDISVTFGADGAGSVTLADTTAALDAAGFTSNGDTVTFTLSNDGLTLTGSANGSTIVTVAISGNATDGFRYDATLTGPLDHPAGDADLNLPITIVATDGDGTQTSANASIAITDDGPVANDDTVVVVEEASGSVGTDQGADNLLANDDLGADGGSLVSFTYTDANGASASANAGSTVTTQFGSLTVNGDGTWSYTPGAAANNAGGVSDGFTYTVRDADGDEASATQGITITDSGAPVLSAAGSTVAESEITDTAGQDISVTFGADGVGSVTLADTTAALDAAGFTSNGDAVTFTLSNDGLILTGSANGSTVVTVAISGNATDGFRYDATLTGPLDHPPGDADLNLPITIVATDGDGTQTSANASIAITDDGPVAVNDGSITVVESAGPIGTAQGAANLLANDDMGADGGSLVSFTYTDANGQSATANAGSTVETQYGSLTVNANGTWSYTPGAAPNHNSTASDDFSYTIRDADGDEATATHGITLTDDFKPVVDFGTGKTNVAVRIDEDDLSNGTDGTGPTTVGDTILVKVGVDGLASVTISPATVSLLNQTTLKSGGSKINFSLSDDGTVMTGTADGETVLTVAVTGNPTDGFRFDVTLSGPIDHFSGFGENSTGTLPLTFIATDGDGTKGQDRALLFITDDVPTLTNDTVVTVAESGGVATTGNLLANADLGADDSNGLAVAKFTYTDDNGEIQQGVLGQVMDTQFGKLTVNADGTWSYTADEAADQTNGPVGDDFTYSIVDADGDFATAIQNIDIVDSGSAPAIDPEGGVFGGTVSEAGLEEGAVVLTQQADVAFGPDGPASENPVVFTADIASTLADRGLTSGGAALTYSLSEDGMTVTASAGGETVFTIALGDVSPADAAGNATYDYTFTLHAALDHTGAEGDAIEGILFPVVITDGDGTQTQTDVTINVTDDAPAAVADAGVSLQEGNYSVDSNVMDNDDAGADGATLVSFTYTDANGIEQTAEAGDMVQTQFGTLTVNGDGSWSFDADINAVGELTADASDGFTYVIRDADGDTASAAQGITINAPLDAGATITVSAEGNEDARIPLVITVTPTVASEFLQVVDVTISNLPADATLFDANGIEIAIIDGAATVGADSLQGLEIQRGLNISNDIQGVQVTARIENIALGTTTETTETGTVVVHAVADDPTLTVTATANEVTETESDGRDNGWGNGDDDAPGGSEFNNNAENAGGNDNNMANAPGNSGRGADTGAIAGTDGDDTLRGTAGNDTIVAGAGADTVYGSGGDDDVQGGSGDDVIYGDMYLGTGDISFEISAGLTDLDGSESLSLTMSGLPDTGMLSNAQGDIIPIVNGTATLTGVQLDGLVLTVDADQPAFTVQVQAQSTDTDPDTGATDQSAIITRVLEIVPTSGGVAGDDTLQGGGGSDTIYGNDGDDLILGDGAGTTPGVLGNNLIVNGDFESGAAGIGKNLDVPGWRVHRGGAEVRDASVFGAEDEGHDQVLDSEGKNFTQISQSIDGLQAGQALQLSFDMAGRTGRHHNDADGYQVYWNGELVAEITDVQEWETYTVDLIAGSGNGKDILMFQGVGEWSGRGALLDNVALRTVETDTGNVAGDDELHGGAGNDDVAGNAGNDWIVGGTDNGQIDVNQTLDATFVSSSAGYNNTLGYYVKGEDGEPTIGKILWANANDADRGDTESIDLDGFEADQVGFFLIPDGDRLNGGLSDGDSVTFGLNDQGQWVVERGGEALNGRGFDAYYSDQELNPDGLDHVAEFQQNGIDIVGFEDLPNLGDHDYNDAIFSTDEGLVVGNFAGGDDLWGGEIGGQGDGQKDVFFHAKGDGVDTIHDFEVGIDQLVLSGYDRDDVNFIADGNDTIIHLGDDDAVKLVGVSADVFAAGRGSAIYDADSDDNGSLNVDELVSMKEDLFADDGSSNSPQSEDASVVFVAPIEPGILDGGNNNEGNT